MWAFTQQEKTVFFLLVKDSSNLVLSDGCEDDFLGIGWKQYCEDFHI